MSKKKIRHADAELVLKLYDLRREAVMRQSRDAIAAWQPRSAAEVVEVTSPRHPLNAAWRQVSSYFEMAYGFARHGVVDADFLAENAGEGLFLFAKIKPHLAALRAATAPTALRNAEWMVKKSDVAREKCALFAKRIAKALAESKPG
jgi:hypothetical protein